MERRKMFPLKLNQNERAILDTTAAQMRRTRADTLRFLLMTEHEKNTRGEHNHAA